MAAVFYVESIDSSNGELHDVFIWSENDKGVSSVVTARTAIQRKDSQTGHRGMVLFDGHRFEVRIKTTLLESL